LRVNTVSLSILTDLTDLLVLGVEIIGVSFSSKETPFVIWIILLSKSISDHSRAKASPFRIPVKASIRKNALNFKFP